jgi:hypothetical protein
MLWNEIRYHIHYRLPAIIDFILFGLSMSFIAAVLLGLVAVYIEYGVAVFGVAIISLCLVGLLSGRRTQVYCDNDSAPFVLGGDSKQSLPPPGKQALPGPGPEQIGRALPRPKK